MSSENNNPSLQPDYSFIMDQQTGLPPPNGSKKKMMILAGCCMLLMITIGISVFSSVQKNVKRQDSITTNNHIDAATKFLNAIQSKDNESAYNMVTQENKNASLAKFDSEMSSKLQRLIAINTCSVDGGYTVGNEGFLDLSCETKETEGVVTFELRTVETQEQITISGINMKKLEQKS